MGLRILANENVPQDAIAALRAAGHDVACASDSPRGADPVVLARASAEERLLLTFDRDFGALAFATRQPAPFGIILLRVRRRSPEHVVSVLLDVLARPVSWAHMFTVVEPDRVRMTPLPPV